MTNRHERRSNKGGAHHVVAATAMELAGYAYEVLASGSNDWYRANPSQRRFILRKWHTFVERARETLVDLLADPNTHDNLKQEIFEALTLDGALNPPIIHAEREAGLLN